MPDRPVTGLVGKLPAHGDFVRRGGPPAMLDRIDRWLDLELSRALTASPMAVDEGVAALAGWRFALGDGDGATLGTMQAGVDAVGRVFPLIGIVRIAGLVAFGEADRWCAAAAASLDAARDAGATADAALADLAGVQAPAPGSDAAAGWWRAGDAAATGEPSLPTGLEFERLLGKSP